MKRRWNVILVCTHIAVAAVLVTQEEVRAWNHFAYWQQLEAKYGTPYNPVPSPELRFVFDYWPSKAEKSVDVLNLPAILVVGWYSHPFNRSDSLLSAVELGLTKKLTVKARVIALDLVLLLFIGFQWLLIGYAIQRRQPLVGFVRSVFVFVTVAGVLMACLCLPPWWQDNRYVDVLAFSLVMSVLCAWVVGAAAGAAAALLYYGRAITQRLT